MKHEHNLFVNDYEPCRHKIHGESMLILCEECSKVYCRLCGREWGEKEIVYVSIPASYQQPLQPYVNPWIVPNTTPWSPWGNIIVTSMIGQPE